MTQHCNCFGNVLLVARPLNPFDQPVQVADLKVNLESSTNRKPDEMELLMALTKSPLFVEYMEQATADARSLAYRSVVESMMVARFGSLDEHLSAIIPNIIKLPPSEFTPLVLEMSREELIDRFTPKI
jgi:hypothetical protein